MEEKPLSNNKIKVSVIIPAYNVEKYIEKCIRSVINQTLKDIEIIVINDGSTDNTKKIIENIMSYDKRIILINKKNAGLSSARNSGISVAKGEYIQHIDGDDSFESNGCEELYNFAKEKNLDMAVVSYIAETKEGSKILIKDNLPENVIYTGEEYLKYFFDDESKASVCAKFIKRELYYNISHPESISLGEDLATTPRLAIRSTKIAKYHNSFLNYTYNDNSITRNKFGTKMFQLFEVFDIIRNDFKVNKKLEKFNSQITSLETMRVNAFLVLPSFWEDEGYIKSFNLVLSFFKNKNPIPKRITFFKSMILKFLFIFPYKYNLILAIKLSNILSKLKNNQ